MVSKTSSKICSSIFYLVLVTGEIEVSEIFTIPFSYTCSQYFVQLLPPKCHLINANKGKPWPLSIQYFQCSSSIAVPSPTTSTLSKSPNNLHGPGTSRSATVISRIYGEKNWIMHVVMCSHILAESRQYNNCRQLQGCGKRHNA